VLRLVEQKRRPGAIEEVRLGGIGEIHRSRR
jgi:hypothetical protein